VRYYAREYSVSSGKRWNVSLGVVTSREASWLGTRLTCLAIITSCTVLSTHTDPVPRFWGDVRALRVDESSLVPSQYHTRRVPEVTFHPKVELCVMVVSQNGLSIG
jgi:hypothetical protein